MPHSERVSDSGLISSKVARGFYDSNFGFTYKLRDLRVELMFKMTLIACKSDLRNSSKREKAVLTVNVLGVN